MFNKITVIGNVGRDPEMRYTPSGAALTEFSIATNRRYTTAGRRAAGGDRLVQRHEHLAAWASG